MASTASSSFGKSDSGKATVPTSDPIHSHLLSSTDAHIAHLNKILATSSGVDSTLTLVGYSLLFVSSQLTKLQSLELQSFAKRFALSAFKALGPGEGVVATVPAPKSMVKIGELAQGTKALAGLCSDFRAFTRLWGLLGVWAGAKKLYLNPPKDSVVKGVAWGQLSALGLYLVYENGYYLAGKGVLLGWTPQKQKRWAKQSLKLFLAYLALEWIKLFRTRQLREAGKAQGETAEKVEARKKEEAAWWNAAIANAAYTPPAMHWASETGLLSEAWVGLLVGLVGWMKFKVAWAQTA